MSINYFILSKSQNQNIDDKTNSNIYEFDKKKVYILPYNNIQYYKERGLFESNLIEWCKQFCNTKNIFLDIGAHSGTYAISLAHLCEKVYAFEPQKMTYYTLCGSVALSNLNNVECVNIALGSLEQVGTMQLNIVSLDGGGSSLQQRDTTKILKNEIVKVKTLDSLNIRNIGFIKIDVEDNEINVLKGAIETIKENNYPKIVFESNSYNKELFQFINSFGYKISKITGYNNMYIAYT